MISMYENLYLDHVDRARTTTTMKRKYRYLVPSSYGYVVCDYMSSIPAAILTL